MTHITEERVMRNHADMGGSTTVATRSSLTVTDILPAAVRRRNHAQGNECDPVHVGFRRRGNPGR
jgi:hypothetical protein